MDRCNAHQRQKWILLGVPVLFFLGSALHFAYQLLGEPILIALIAPVNESVWEHGKMILWPMILWWGFYSYICNLSGTIRQRWLAGTVTALVSALIVMPMLYYFYTQAFGVERLWVDILILLLSILTGQLLGMHLYLHSGGIPARISLCILLATVLLFAAFTFNPPHLPWFQDGTTGAFGIGLN